ncbi:MAG: class I SAM-dependent methyltransferase [Kiritimatiellia bacterium]
MHFEPTQIPVGEETIHLRYAREVEIREKPAYWASLWPASLALAEHVLDGEALPGKQVLEIGCGCGLAGIAAGMQGAEVTVTDLEPEALKLAEENWRRNGLEPAALEPMNWNHPGTRSPFDLILAADVLYDPKEFPGLIQSIHLLLDAEGCLLLSEPGRPQARDFFAGVLQAGFQVESCHRVVSLHGEEYEITVSEIR